MSKHLGNVLEPIPLMEAHGADALRWFFTASGSPWATRKISDAVLAEIVRKVLLTYWNTTSFLVLYANAAGAQGNAWHPERNTGAPDVTLRPVLDRWVLSELHALVRDVTADLEAFDSAAAGRRIAAFIDDVSNWYVRRSQDQRPPADEGSTGKRPARGQGSTGKRPARGQGQRRGTHAKQQQRDCATVAVLSQPGASGGSMRLPGHSGR